MISLLLVLASLALRDVFHEQFPNDGHERAAHQVQVSHCNRQSYDGAARLSTVYC